MVDFGSGQSLNFTPRHSRHCDKDGSKMAAATSKEELVVR
jgi:hypothetical protein